MLFTLVQEIIEIPEDAYKKNTVYRPWPANADFGNRHNSSLKSTPKSAQNSYAAATDKSNTVNPYDANDSRFAATPFAR